MDAGKWAPYSEQLTVNEQSVAILNEKMSLSLSYHNGDEFQQVNVGGINRSWFLPAYI